MKSKKTSKKLVLSKETIVRLENSNMEQMRGGMYYTDARLDTCDPTCEFVCE
ncbi:MAG: hypothetical protein GY940_15735 [bacterium]|nr:hypothetical protein [bacterium]